MFLIDRQGIGPVGGERYEGADGSCVSSSSWKHRPASLGMGIVRIAGTGARLSSGDALTGLLSSGEIVWVGSKTTGSKAKEPGLVALHPADSLLLTVQDGRRTAKPRGAGHAAGCGDGRAGTGRGISCESARRADARGMGRVVGMRGRIHRRDIAPPMVRLPVRGGPMVAGLAGEGHQQLVRSAEIPRSVIPCGEGPSPCITAQGAGQGQCPGEHDGTMIAVPHADMQERPRSGSPSRGLRRCWTVTAS